ncbi:hypothetical protein GT370_09295 [Acidocella sp. MX-AZ03]|uniref:hypothetical protein n=1 Tax=Acidocella sp. MX-AZ03 TaxID=2697363 RepID=UPI0022DCF2B6|nr:hypothetical protein [Acidocella sp. MX-AZ03]WBO60895.1 hypothetical protein GT370_09295 [Acidocella sp. MX-AZ03]
MMRRLCLLSSLAFLAAAPAFSDAPPALAACESHDPTAALQGCGAVLDAGQDMEAYDFEARNNRALAELELHQPQPALADALAGIALNPRMAASMSRWRAPISPCTSCPRRWRR